MADDDFDIDIYGDTNIEEDTPIKEESLNTKIENSTTSDNVTLSMNGHKGEEEEEQDDDYVDIKVGREDTHQVEGHQQIKSTDESGRDLLSIPRQAPQQQGTKRKGGADDRHIDPGATTALLISDLHWWNTDDDVRGWINQAQCEDELKDVTFSEHKVNGKSKGQAYVEFTSQQAATAAKHKITSFGEGQQYVKKHVVTYSNPSVNPFKTLPKDAPTRSGKEGPPNRGGNSSYSDRGQSGGYNNNFRGRAGYNSSRGAMNNIPGGFNRNFGNQMGGMASVGFQPPMNTFQNGNIGGQFGSFNRGGMMNGMRGNPGVMRGGRGTMGNGMMGSMPLGGMGMGMQGAMNGMNLMPNMSHMGAGMPGAGFASMQNHFNPAFFQQSQATNGGDWQNPHGVKRPRPE